MVSRQVRVAVYNASPFGRKPSRGSLSTMARPPPGTRGDDIRNGVLLGIDKEWAGTNEKPPRAAPVRQCTRMPETPSVHPHQDAGQPMMCHDAMQHRAGLETSAARILKSSECYGAFVVGHPKAWATQHPGCEPPDVDGGRSGRAGLVRMNKVDTVETV